MPDTIEIPFVFALGEHVHWAAGGEAWAFAWQVLQQRRTVSLVTTVHDYLLIAVTDPQHAPVWAYEADLAPWHGRST